MAMTFFPTQEYCPIDVLPLDLIAYCFLHLQSFKDLGSSSSIAVVFDTCDVVHIVMQGFAVGTKSTELFTVDFRISDFGASIVCRKWRDGVKCAVMHRQKISFSGWRVDDACVGRLVEGAYSLRELDISTSRWGCNITNSGLKRISLAPCCPNLISISLWGVSTITDEGVIQLVTSAKSLQNLNIGGTLITDKTIFAIARHCRKLKVLNLWACRHITEDGLLALGSGCPDLRSINIFGLKVPTEFYKYLLTMKPHLELRTGTGTSAQSRVPYWEAAH